MDVRNVRWVGTATANYRAMTRFAEKVLGLQVNFEEAASMELTTLDGDRLQIIGPGHAYYDFFGRHANGPVPLFEVTDVLSAAAELQEAGIEIVGSHGVDSNWRWVNFRAPDGHLYEIASPLRPRVE
jgi:catechol 2,3-dioxygenase-like lactoylglutathione lyase family enzyme